MKYENLKKWLRRLFLPHPALLIVLVPPAAALVTYSLMYLPPSAPLSIAAYAFSAYALTLLCCRIPEVLAFIRRVKQDNRYIRRYTEDVQLRVNLSLYMSLIWNMAYGVLQLVLGLKHHTVWYYAFSGYYILIGTARFFLLKYTRRNRAGENPWTEWLIYRLTGLLLMLINLSLMVIITYIVLQKRTFVHHPIVAIAMAAYTFTALGAAVTGFIRTRIFQSPVFNAAKVLSLASALTSLITLENTLLTTFGGPGQERFRFIMLAVTGFGITVPLLAAAVIMLIKSTRKIKELKHG